MVQWKGDQYLYNNVWVLDVIVMVVIKTVTVFSDVTQCSLVDKPATATSMQEESLRFWLNMEAVNPSEILITCVTLPTRTQFQYQNS
jgi:hypothetical protein